jgi:hypothetical protein
MHKHTHTHTHTHTHIHTHQKFLQRKAVTKEKEKTCSAFLFLHKQNSELYGLIWHATCSLQNHISEQNSASWNKKHICIVYSLRNDMRVVKLRSQRWMGHFSHIEQVKNACKMLFGARNRKCY